jgi:hypothetical protein
MISSWNITPRIAGDDRAVIYDVVRAIVYLFSLVVPGVDWPDSVKKRASGFEAQLPCKDESVGELVGSLTRRREPTQIQPPSQGTLGAWTSTDSGTRIGVGAWLLSIVLADWLRRVGHRAPSSRPARLSR